MLDFNPSRHEYRGQSHVRQHARQAVLRHSFGESHGAAIGCVVDGCPPGMMLSEADIQTELDRRRPALLATSPSARKPTPSRYSPVCSKAQLLGPPSLAHPQRRCAQQGLQQHRRYFPSRACGLHLLAEVRRARLSRWWAAICARDRRARRCRRYREEMASASVTTSSCAASLSKLGPIGVPLKSWDAVECQSVFRRG
jgi:hypothetical protein